MFNIIKKTADVWWHEYNGSTRHISNFVVVSDIEAQTFFIRAISGASFPLEAVNISDIAVIDETDSSTVETFANITDLLDRLVALQYTPYRTSGGGGGAVNSVNGQVGTVVLDADDIDDSATAHKFVTASEKTAITHANRSTLDAITEPFTTALKTAYDSASSWIITNGTNVLSHIANTSNPHSTTASQVGAYTTTQVDALLALKANLYYMYKVPTTSYITGSTSEIEVLKVTIPANTFSAQDVLKLHRFMFEKVGTAGGFTARFKISTSSTMPSGTTDQVGVIGLTGATTIWQSFSRNLYIEGGNIKGFPFAVSTSVDNSTSTTAVSSKAFDRTVTQYLYVSITLANSADQVRIGGGLISNI